jgi:hypothetical protein
VVEIEVGGEQSLGIGDQGDELGSLCFVIGFVRANAFAGVLETVSDSSHLEGGDHALHEICRDASYLE